VQEPHITVTGNVGAEPRTRVLAGGAVVTDFRIASTPRLLDKDTDAWKDGETMWFGVSCWRALAENVAASLHKGDRVVVSGRLKVSTWVTDKGEPRSGLEIISPVVGFDLSRGTAVLHKNPPLTVATDPGYPGLVDLDTGEVLEDDRDDDEVPLGGLVGATG
jgi:single-strand DNA-binding protein